MKSKHGKLPERKQAVGECFYISKVCLLADKKDVVSCFCVVTTNTFAKFSFKD